MKQTDGGVTLPSGFTASAFAAGIKKAGRNDMALLYSKTPCHAAGTFTSNLVKAAPVIWDRDLIKEGNDINAVVVNSGVANACTGQEGFGYCKDTADTAAGLLGVSYKNVLVASTGVIGRQLPMDKITEGVRNLVPLLADGRQAANDAACAIMTTDTVSKETAYTFTLDGKECAIAGMSKGSGMINPKMCTMLAFITTDAAISREMLQTALSEVVEDTFNMISVDGDTSTNDTCVVLANGLAGNTEITEKNEDYDTFKEVLFAVSKDLAMMMAADGEGASCLFEVTVKGAETVKQAKNLSMSVISSNLTKAAIFGHDANWGRIICAMGYSGEIFDPDKVDLTFISEAGSLQILENGLDTGYSEELATKILSEKKITALIDLKQGGCEATAWGCDLTFKYVSINADYRS